MRTQEPDNNNNILLAIVLSIGVLLIWQIFYAGPRMKDEQDRLKRVQQETSLQQPGGQPAPAADGKLAGAPPSAGVQSTTTAAGVPAVPAGTRQTALQSSPRVTIDTASLRGSINLKGGRIDDIELKKYRETVDPNSPNIVLFSPADAPNSYFAEHGWSVAGSTPVAVPDKDTVWSVAGGRTLTATSPVQLSWDNGQGLIFRRTISVDDDYMFKIADQVENRTGAEVTLHPYARIYRYGTPKIEGFFIQHEGAVGFIGDARLQELTYSGLQDDKGSRAFKDKTGGWLGFTDKYWASALIPAQSMPYDANIKLARKKDAIGKEAFQTDYLSSSGLTIGPGETRSVEGQLFAGAKKVDLIQAYEVRDKILEFNYIIDWGWFFFITKPLFYLIDWLYRLFGNFGLAILAVTVLVKAVFFPLANKSYESMAKMKKLQPEMERIRERHKDDRAAQQKELMGLYQKQKINPLAGCLPILVQIPVFFALYKVLFVTIDMRHAPFFGWIRDLSAPDPTSLFNLFGLLPFVPPEFLHIGVWPIIMGITMWLQMQLNPQQPDPVQQQIFNWMPVFFTFLLAPFAAGLVIYWAWNNILSLSQQWIIMKRQGVDVPIVDNIKRNFAGIRRALDFDAIARLLGLRPAEADAAKADAANTAAPARDKADKGSNSIIAKAADGVKSTAGTGKVSARPAEVKPDPKYNGSVPRDRPE